MERSPEALANSQKSSASKSYINLLEVIVLLFSIAIIVLGIIDEHFRQSLEKVAIIVISGYLGNKVPK